MMYCLVVITNAFNMPVHTIPCHATHVVRRDYNKPETTTIYACTSIKHNKIKIYSYDDVSIHQHRQRPLHLLPYRIIRHRIRYAMPFIVESVDEPAR